MQPLEMWGGIECTVVRIGNTWRDQVRETGHHDSSDDLARIAELGIRKLRYPVLWERCHPGQPGACGWAWHDRQLDTLERLGISPIVGLLHHGMGPAGTGLLESGFAEGLARHAGRAAQRYRFVEWWAPVNEPLTTARFACLYGFWHPHQRDEGAFLRATVAQCRAVLLSMQAIRAHSPQARFIQTENLGYTFATPQMNDQAAYENDRRWLSLDLLCGRVGRSHPWRAHLLAHGVAERDLDELATGHATPDMIGINHYVTSDRFLDHRLHLYPAHLHGGNGRIAYADTEAARVNLPIRETGWVMALRDAWERYGLPIAVTEAHLGCNDPREQVRWLVDAWRAAQALRVEGADIQAVTAWALLGLVDWDTMLVERNGRFEPGALAARKGVPQSALLAEAIASLVSENHFTHPALLSLGWWQRDDRAHAKRA